MTELSQPEQNLIKDILKLIGRDDDLNTQVATSLGMSVDQFNGLSDSAFIKLGNGRLIVEENG